MFYELVSSEDIGAVTVSEAKDFLKIDSDITKDDSIIADIICAVFDYAEHLTGHSMREKVWNGFYEGVCISNNERLPFVQIDKPPVSAITSVDVSSGGVYSATSDFIRKRGRNFDRILFTTTPKIDNDAAYTIKVVFSSGYTSEDIPRDLKQALLQHIAFMYENRGDAPSDPQDQILEVYHRHRSVVTYAA